MSDFEQRLAAMEPERMRALIREIATAPKNCDVDEFLIAHGLVDDPEETIEITYEGPDGTQLRVEESKEFGDPIYATMTALPADVPGLDQATCWCYEPQVEAWEAVDADAAVRFVRQQGWARTEGW